MLGLVLKKNLCWLLSQIFGKPFIVFHKIRNDMLSQCLAAITTQLFARLGRGSRIELDLIQKGVSACLQSRLNAGITLHDRQDGVLLAPETENGASEGTSHKL